MSKDRLKGSDKYRVFHNNCPKKNSLLLLKLKYESERLPEPTQGLPDVVHLLKYAF